MKEISIVRLHERPDALNTIASWIDRQWGAFSGRSLSETIYRFAREGDQQDLPITLVALDSDKPVGVATLRARDSVDWDPGVTPWICNVYVPEEERGGGVAGKLCEALETLAVTLGYTETYLATEISEGSLYHRLGYGEYKVFDDGKHRLHLLRRKLVNEVAVACIGGGVIGSAWAALFASYGLQVRVQDPREEAQATIRTMAERAALALGRTPESILQHVTFTTDLDEALAGVAFVQESGPDSLDFKQRVFADLDRRLPPSVIIASSTSELPISAIQSMCAHPERTVVGHPINPPYAVALVEVVGGGQTSDETLERTCAFYRSVGRAPLRVDRENRGFVANRLQIALLREALQMIVNREATVEQVDFALMHGIGARWAAVGMFGAYFLNLPAPDVQAWLAHFERIRFGEELVHTEPFPEWTPAVQKLIAEQWRARIDRTGRDVLLKERDAFCVALGRQRTGSR